MKYDFLFRMVFEHVPEILNGLGVTVRISVSAIILSTLLGISVAFFSINAKKFFRKVLNGYIEIMRNVPLLVQLYFIYFGLYELNIQIGSYGSIILALMFCNGAYLGEIFRAGLESIPRSQTEAGLSLGLTYSQTFFKIILPQAFRNVIPPVTNQYIIILLSSSFASMVAVEELTSTISRLSSFTFRTFEFYIIGALLYVVLSMVISILSKWTERWLATRNHSVHAMG